MINIFLCSRFFQVFYEIILWCSSELFQQFSTIYVFREKCESANDSHEIPRLIFSEKKKNVVCCTCVIGTSRVKRYPYGKCPKISYTKFLISKWHMQTVQTQSRGSSLLRVYALCHSTVYFFRNNCTKSKI